MASAPAIATRCRSPPERVAITRSARWAHPTAPSASSTRLRISSRGSPRFSGPNATSSRTVTPKNCRSGFWKTMPTRCASADRLERGGGLPIDQDRPRRPLADQPLDQRGQGALAAPARPGQEHELAGRDR